ncbi:HET-domain-containing protein, partial [Thozetella sp. PMI_491]
MLTNIDIYSDRAIWKNTQAISFEQSIPILKGWYEECTSQHAGCSSLAKPLPTRLLSIGPDADSNPRLVKTVGQVGIYAALSHCWGKAQDTIRTTTALLGEFSTSIELTRFPKTFRDAITVTRLLGIEYLWIDSLCIVQDDEEDWQKESARMSSVFTNTNLTVAATASEDSHGGCLFDREPAVHVLVANKEEEAADADAGSSCYVRYPAEEATSLRSSPLYQRGWVLQEMVLSRRTVHFARDQLFWHCCSRITSEDGYFDASLGSTYFDLENPAKAHQSWWTCVEDYSNRKLTKESDKFAALAGLIKAFPLDAKPIAGLWEDDIHFGLLWCTRGPATRCGMDGIPTWSWASVNSPV